MLKNHYHFNLTLKSMVELTSIQFCFFKTLQHSEASQRLKHFFILPYCLGFYYQGRGGRGGGDRGGGGVCLEIFFNFICNIYF